MKNLLFVAFFAIALVFSSCGADNATVEAMADDMCKIMDKYNPDDPMSAFDLLSDISALADKEGYNSVSEAQLNSAMEKKCPDAYKKYQDLLNAGK